MRKIMSWKKVKTWSNCTGITNRVRNQSLLGADARSGSLWRGNLGQAQAQARENSEDHLCEDQSDVESLHTRRRAVRGANHLLTQLRRPRGTVLHGLLDDCGNRVPLGDP